MKDRIKKIIDYSGLTLGVFASRTGIKAANLSHILNGRNNPTLPAVTGIHDSFPEISLEWILTGKGAMFNSGSTEQPVNKPVESGSATSTNQFNRTIFDSDQEIENTDLVEDDDSEDAVIEPENTNVANNETPDNIVSNHNVEESKLADTVVSPQRSESEIIDSFLKSDIYKNMMDTQIKYKEKSVKKIIVLYDDETFAEYSLNKL